MKDLELQDARRKLKQRKEEYGAYQLRTEESYREFFRNMRVARRPDGEMPRGFSEGMDH